MASAGGAGTRLRPRTYIEERKDYPWRVAPRLHARVTSTSERGSVTTTEYVLDALDAAVKGGVTSGRVATYEETPGEERVTVTLRMPAALYARVRKAATKARVSMNRYISFVVHEKLGMG